MIEPFVPWARALAENPNAVIADVRWDLTGPKRSAYDAGHVPDAVFVDVDTDLAAPSGRHGRHPLPDPDDFAEAMGRVGIDGSRPVLAYDDEGGVMAARLVWMLRVLGHEAAIADGGLQAYVREIGGPLAIEQAPIVAAVFPAAPWPRERLVDIDGVAFRDRLLIDARPAERFRGQGDATDARSGHIPGAVSVPCRENLTSDLHLQSVPSLVDTFTAAGVETAEDVISSCGSGVTACHNLLAMEHAGLGLGALYPGSWSEWSADPSRPVES